MQNSIFIREKFSKASGSYDEHALIQRQIADELFNRLAPLDSVKNILDIGIGTGYLSEKIKLKYPHLEVFGLDSAWGMLNKAKEKNIQIHLLGADAKELPFKNNTFEVVISNLTYQWVLDLESAFGEVKRILKEKGRFYFTVFLEDTLKELKETIFELMKRGTRDLDSITNLPNRASVKMLLEKNGFENIKTEVKTFRQNYSNLTELLDWLKQIGANRFWNEKFYNGLAARGFLEKIKRAYESRYRDNGNIFATFEVLFVEAQMSTDFF